MIILILKVSTHKSSDKEPQLNKRTVQNLKLGLLRLSAHLCLEAEWKTDSSLPRKLLESSEAVREPWAEYSIAFSRSDNSVLLSIRGITGAHFWAGSN